MPTSTLSDLKPIEIVGLAGKHAETIAQANRFRALAWAALRDGAPKSELRAAHARAAVRSLLQHARRAEILRHLTPETMPVNP